MKDMKEKAVERYMSKYSEIRGVLTKKRKSFLGRFEIFVISDGTHTVSVKAGKGLGEMYEIGCELTVGYIGRRLINIRPGITYGDK